MKNKWYIAVCSLVLATALTTSCDALRIDEDLSDCKADFHVSYSVTLRTNLRTQIQTVLRSRFETEVADLLEDSLRNIFREYAHDVDLSFYIQNSRSYHDSKVMDANQATYELELPANDYRHLALANIDEEKDVDVVQPQWADRSYLTQEGGDVILGHHTGLFSARRDMDIVGNQNQTFDVTLYMVNCASILVLRTDLEKNVVYKDCQVYSSDFADGFMVNDSTFTFGKDQMIHDFRVTTPPVEREVFYAVSFPSHDTAEEAQASRADNPSGQTGAQDEERIWRKYVYVTLPDGTVTRTVINVREPLQAGQIYIIYAYMRPDGSIFSPNVEVSTSVTLKWKDGLIIGG